MLSARLRLPFLAGLAVFILFFRLCETWLFRSDDWLDAVFPGLFCSAVLYALMLAWEKNKIAQTASKSGNLLSLQLWFPFLIGVAGLFLFFNQFETSYFKNWVNVIIPTVLSSIVLYVVMLFMGRVARPY